MALIEVTQTVAQVEGVTRNTLFKRLLRETGLGATGVATTGSTSTINDTTRLKSAQLTSSDWVGGWARISKDAGGAAAAPEGEISPITTYDPTTNGRITFEPVMTAAVAVGDEYELWRFPSPSITKDFLDQCLQNDIYLPCWSILSELPDFDMEANNTTDWTGVSATVTKITGTEPVLDGKRWLSVLATAANGYARTTTFKVEPGKRYHISAIAKPSAVSTTCELQAYDITNSASIDSKTSIHQIPVRIDFEITAPSTCYQMQLRLITQEDTKTTLWDEIVIYAVDSSDISLPSWVKNKNQVKGIFELSMNQLGANIYDIALTGKPINKYDIVDNAFGRGQLKLVSLNGSGISKPLFIFGIRNEVAYANDNTDSKRVDENLLFSCLAYKLFTHLKQLPNAGNTNATWIRAQANEYEKQYLGYSKAQSEQLEEIIQTVQSSGYYADQRFRY